MKTRMILGLVLIIVGATILLNSSTSITGLAILEDVGKITGSILGIALIVGGLILLMNSSRGGKGEDLEKKVKFFHGAMDKNKAEDIRRHGPSKEKAFFITRSKSVAHHAAGPDGSIITFEIPPNEARKYTSKEREYMGVLGEGTEVKIEGKDTEYLMKFISEKDYRPEY